MSYRHFGRLLSCLLLVIVTSYALADAPITKPLPKIVLVGTQDTYDSPIGKWLTLVYTTAFERLGYQLIYEPYPSKRASIISDDGVADGEIFRFFEYGDTHPNLIRVNESPFSVNWSAYSVSINTPLNGWASLANTAYRVGYRSGSRKLEYELPKVRPTSALIPANNTISGLEMLNAKRTDIYVDLEDLVQERLSKNSKMQHIKQIGLLETCPMYAFLNKRHQALVTPLENTLKDMKNEGIIERYRIEAQVGAAQVNQK